MSPNESVLEDWEIVAPAGHGAFSKAHLARRRSDGLKAVIKTFAGGELDRFEREARILAAVDHPNIIRLLDQGRDSEKAWLAFAHEDGETLEALLSQSRGKLGEARALSILGGLLDALESMHGAGYLHRDIKSSNILVRPGDRPLLLDFGAALPIGDESQDSHDFSELTPGYAPLEQYRQGGGPGGGEGPWTDIYALGAVLYGVVAGKAPLEAPNRESGEDQESAEGAGRERYSRGLLKTIDWALKLNPEDRLSSAAQWKEEIN